MLFEYCKYSSIKAKCHRKPTAENCRQCLVDLMIEIASIKNDTIDKTKEGIIDIDWCIRNLELLEKTKPVEWNKLGRRIQEYSGGTTFKTAREYFENMTDEKVLEIYKDIQEALK